MQNQGKKTKYHGYLSIYFNGERNQGNKSKCHRYLSINLMAHFNYNKNCGKIVGFKEQKNILLSSKLVNLV
jgi:hypothetical protein